MGEVTVEFKSDLPEEQHELVVRRVQVVPNFPKSGLVFKDLSHVIGDPKSFRYVIDLFVNRYRDMGITAVAGIESRGFIFASPVALGLKLPFVPFRKPGKLPCESVGIDINLEVKRAGASSSSFGKDRLETHEGGINQGDKILIMDDMLGSGATLKGACELCEKFGAVPVECAVITELRGMKGRKMLEGYSVYVLLQEHDKKQ